LSAIFWSRLSSVCSKITEIDCKIPDVNNCAEFDGEESKVSVVVYALYISEANKTNGVLDGDCVLLISEEQGVEYIVRA
jgi:hypothetical protein